MLIGTALIVGLSHCGDETAQSSGEPDAGSDAGDAKPEGSGGSEARAGSGHQSSAGAKAEGGTGGDAGGHPGAGATPENQAGAGNGFGGRTSDEAGGTGQSAGGSDSGEAAAGGTAAEVGGAAGSATQGDGGEAGAAQEPPAECSPSQRKCDGGVRTCEGGFWSAPTPCVGQTCVDGYCQGECAQGTTSCIGNAPAACNASGAWSASASCGASQTCLNGVCGGECGPGERTCTTFLENGFTVHGIGSCGTDGKLHGAPCDNYLHSCIDAVASAPRAAMCGCGWLYNGFRLDDGDWLVSCDNKYALMLEHGRMRLIHADNANVALWDVGQDSGGAGSVLVMQGDGNLVLYAPGCTGANGSCWTSGTSGHPGADFVLQEDGNLVIYGSDCPPPYGACWSRYGG